jgi:formate hydrogenlyase subunit 3/multisubunit Na+/H+ antiporter MnhD subunit
MPRPASAYNSALPNRAAHMSQFFPYTLSPLSAVMGIVGWWLLLAASSLAGLRWQRVVIRVVFPLGALGGLALAAAAAAALSGDAAAVILPLGLPDLPFHLRLDPLSAVFLLLLGATTTGVSLFAADYLRNMDRLTLSLLSLQYHVFLASMALVLLADDAYLFMVAWEAMAMASYFLVTTNHRLEEVRRAGFIYLLVAHVGALCILLCFGVLSGGFGDYSFDHMRYLGRDEFWSSAVFLLALLGFGAKAGLLPVHVWLPEAHPAAPSPVSALMSAVMLKTAV